MSSSFLVAPSPFIFIKLNDSFEFYLFELCMTLAVGRILLFAQLKMRRFIVYDALNSAGSMKLFILIILGHLSNIKEISNDCIDYFNGIRPMKIQRNKEM